MLLLPLVVFALVFLIGITVVDRKIKRDGQKFCDEHADKFGDLPGVCYDGKYLSP